MTRRTEFQRLLRIEGKKLSLEIEDEIVDVFYNDGKYYMVTEGNTIQIILSYLVHNLAERAKNLKAISNNL